MDGKKCIICGAPLDSSADGISKCEMCLEKERQKLIDKSFWGGTAAEPESDVSSPATCIAEPDSDTCKGEETKPEKPPEDEEKPHPPIKEPEPEEIELKKKNARDFIILGLVVSFLIAGIIFGTLFLYNSGNRKIYSLIDTGSYAVAFKEIAEIYDRGENVDIIAEKYIEACIKDGEYKRVAQAMNVFSDEHRANTDYYTGIIEEVINSGRISHASAIANAIPRKNDALDVEIDKIKTNINK